MVGGDVVSFQLGTLRMAPRPPPPAPAARASTAIQPPSARLPAIDSRTRCPPGLGDPGGQASNLQAAFRRVGVPQTSPWARMEANLLVLRARPRDVDDVARF